MTPFLLAQVVQLNCVQVVEQYSTDGFNQGHPSVHRALLDLSSRQGILTIYDYIKSAGGYIPSTEKTDSLMLTKNHIIFTSEGPYMFTINRRSLKAGYTRPTSINESEFRYQCKLE